MKFIETKLKGAYLIELEPAVDNRGYFARSFCQKEFKRLGLNTNIAQCNISYNEKKGTLRGLHFQAAPYEEAKLVSCFKGSIYDVIVDIRPDSSTYLEWVGIELSEDNHSQLYIPEGFAHGFQTLCNNTVVSYQMGEFYYPNSASGIRFDDPMLTIKWPLGNKIISEKDLSYKGFSE